MLRERNAEVLLAIKYVGINSFRPKIHLNNIKSLFVPKIKHITNITKLLQRSAG
jgi:hypothetical protein